MMKKTTLLVIALFLLSAVIVVSCSKSNEEDMTTSPPSGFDTVNMTYSADVVPILKASCYSCHGNGGNSGGVNLDTYNNVKVQASISSATGLIVVRSTINSASNFFYENTPFFIPAFTNSFAVF